MEVMRIKHVMTSFPQDLSGKLGWQSTPVPSLEVGLRGIVVLCRRPWLKPSTFRQGYEILFEVISIEERRWRNGSIRVCYLILTSLCELHLNMVEAWIYTSSSYRLHKGTLGGKRQIGILVLWDEAHGSYGGTHRACLEFRQLDPCGVGMITWESRVDESSDESSFCSSVMWRILFLFKAFKFNDGGTR